MTHIASKYTIFAQNTQGEQILLPFLLSFFSNLLHLNKASLGTMTIFLSSYLKTEKGVAFCCLLVL